MGGSGSEELKNALPLPLQSCDSLMVVKENPDRIHIYIHIYISEKINRMNKQKENNSKIYSTLMLRILKKTHKHKKLQPLQTTEIWQKLN